MPVPFRRYRLPNASGNRKFNAAGNPGQASHSGTINVRCASITLCYATGFAAVDHFIPYAGTNSYPWCTWYERVRDYFTAVQHGWHQ